jgi:prephenate dehydratase
VYADGHVADELLADTMRSLHAKQARVKFLGSYPAVGEHAEEARVESGGRWDQADGWLADIRSQINR